MTDKTIEGRLELKNTHIVPVQRNGVYGNKEYCMIFSYLHDEARENKITVPKRKLWKAGLNLNEYSKHREDLLIELSEINLPLNYGGNFFADTPHFYVNKLQRSFTNPIYTRRNKDNNFSASFLEIEGNTSDFRLELDQENFKKLEEMLSRYDNRKMQNDNPIFKLKSLNCKND